MRELLFGGMDFVQSRSFEQNLQRLISSCQVPDLQFCVVYSDLYHDLYLWLGLHSVHNIQASKEDLRKGCNGEEGKSNRKIMPQGDQKYRNI